MAAAVRRGGAQRHTVMLDGGPLHGLFFPLAGDVVGFALRSPTLPSAEEVGRALAVPAWQARHALAAARRLSDHNIAIAFATRGTVDACIDSLSAALIPRVADSLAAGGLGRRVTPPEWRSSALADPPAGGLLLDRASYLHMPPEVQMPPEAPSSPPERFLASGTLPDVRLAEVDRAAASGAAERAPAAGPGEVIDPPPETPLEPPTGLRGVLAALRRKLDRA
jgi:hypothetical protein